MTAVLTKPADRIDAGDIQALVDESVPESAQIEFKESLPARGSGDPDPWMQGAGRIGDRARNEILKEVVAFANAYMSSWVIGIFSYSSVAALRIDSKHGGHGFGISGLTMWSSVIVSSSVPDRTGVGGASAVFRTPDCRLRHQAKCAARSQRRDSAKSPLIGPLSDQDRNRHPGKVESDTRERWGQAACAGHIRSDCGGERAAVIYALIGTAKLDDVDLQASLADVLDRIGEMPQTRLNELLRWHWKAEQ